MKRINLRDYYPFYTSDCFIDVPEEGTAILHDFELREAAYRLRTYRYKAYYLLDQDDGNEHDILFVVLSPCEIYEREVTSYQLHVAIAALLDKQAKHIFAHYFLGMSKTAIAKTEGVRESAVRDAIERGLKHRVGPFCILQQFIFSLLAVNLAKIWLPTVVVAKGEAITRLCEREGR